MSWFSSILESVVSWVGELFSDDVFDWLGEFFASFCG
jgi:hypothetical protein